MPAPYDYTIGQVPNPAQSFLQGIQTVDALRQREEQMAAAEQAKIIERQRQEAAAQLAEKIRSRTVTRGDYEAAMMANPKEYQAYKTAIDSLESEQKNNLFARGMPLYSALFKNTPESLKVAEQLIATDLQAAENRKDAVQVQQITMMRDLLKNNQVDALMGQVGAVMQSIDPERFEKGSSELRKMQEQPYTLRETIAKAGKAEGEAAKTAVEAKYLEREKVAELKKKAADLGLTQANTNKVLAETRKLSAEAAGAALELEALKRGGGIPPAKAFEQEEKLRKEYRTRTQTYQDLSSTFSNLKASAQIGSGPGDIALITGFMKMLDPGSVVRETEFATARDTAGLYANLQNRLEKAKNGQFLNKEQRQEYIALSQKYFDAAQSKAKQDKNALELVVKNYKLNPENVFGEPSSSPVPAAQQRNVVVSY